MVLLSDLNLELPLRNPVIIFALVLFIILFAPILFNRLKVPHIIGLILAGVIVGPYALNLLRRDSSIVLFGTVGLLYIMFLAGLEIDLTEFKKNRGRIIFFGLASFFVPLVTGVVACYYILGYNFLSSLLLASMFSTHTLISYPIASRYGVVKNRAVSLTVGGTMITDILALLILAIVAGLTKEDVSGAFWVRLSVSSVIFVALVFFGFPVMIRWFFKKYDDAVSQYIFVLAVVFLSAFMAEAAGMEAIIGAFFSGLVLNRFIPHTSALMSRIEFVGNALFIPFFLISVGMLVDVSVLFQGFGALKVAAVIIVIAIATKFLVAMVTRKLFRLSSNEGLMIFGLSTSHAAATLAIILVGYNIIIGETPTGDPIRLLNEDVLNGTILLILVSCAVSSFAVQKAARQLAIENENEVERPAEDEQRLLISLAYPDTVADLVELGTLLRAGKSTTPFYALHIIDDESDESAEARGKKMLNEAVRLTTAAGHTVKTLNRYDSSISNGIIYTIKEQHITDLVIGLHREADEKHFLGATTERIVRRTYDTIYIYKPVQPLNTLKRLLVAVPPKAELEPGFSHWYARLSMLARTSGLQIAFYANTETRKELEDQKRFLGSMVPVRYHEFSNWDDFLVLSGELKADDMLTIITSRKGSVSYNPALEKLSYYLTSYFTGNSFLLIYPRQLEQGLKMDNVQYSDTTLLETTGQVLQQPGNWIKELFRKKR
ncbi:MAG TPA: cation:proton antiporter [Chitinophagaceae bacterium]